MWDSDKTMLLVITAIIALVEKPAMAIPRAVPLAGGCSKSKATIKKMEMPTANAQTAIKEKVVWCGISATSEPQTRPVI